VIERSGLTSSGQGGAVRLTFIRQDATHYRVPDLVFTNGPNGPADPNYCSSLQEITEIAPLVYRSQCVENNTRVENKTYLPATASLTLKIINGHLEGVFIWDGLHDVPEGNTYATRPYHDEAALCGSREGEPFPSCTDSGLPAPMGDSIPLADPAFNGDPFPEGFAIASGAAVALMGLSFLFAGNGFFDSLDFGLFVSDALLGPPNTLAAMYSEAVAAISNDPVGSAISTADTVAQSVSVLAPEGPIKTSAEVIVDVLDPINSARDLSSEPPAISQIPTPPAMDLPPGYAEDFAANQIQSSTGGLNPAPTAGGTDSAGSSLAPDASGDSTGSDE